jgi:hypothetical protein
MRLGGEMSHWVDFVTHYKDEIVAVGTFFLAVFAGGSIYIAWQQNKLTRTLERAYLAIKPLGIRPLKSDAGQLVGYIAIENVGHLPAKNDKVVHQHQARQWIERKSVPHWQTRRG